jgi:hypothetical protein
LKITVRHSSNSFSYRSLPHQDASGFSGLSEIMNIQLVDLKA